MFLDLLTVFHMVWKNQECCKSWLLDFQLVGVQKRQNLQPIFFSRFWAAIMDLLITLKYSVFFF